MSVSDSTVAKDAGRAISDYRMGNDEWLKKLFLILIMALLLCALVCLSWFFLRALPFIIFFDVP
jgi:hypothetical protein